MTEKTARHGDEGPGALALLAIHEPDGARDARTRARCHSALERRRRRELGPARPAWRSRLEPAIVGALCGTYLFEVLSRAVDLYRF
jgi:hypothetical protein